jgi:SAM-dependent methyltransferase
MTTLDAGPKPRAPVAPTLFAVTVFASAGLVFLVEPMVAKLVLPMLGGSPSVWNTSLAFFQIALLAGYFYAHALQRVGSLRAQALIHLGVMLAAALTLPLQVSGLLGPPSSEHPVLWLVGVLALSLGAPFAVLSATAPLVQSWHARVVHARTGEEPYALYAASNLGSLLALLAYPILVEPLVTLRGQTASWSLGYGAFILLMGALALLIAWRGGAAQTVEAPAVAAGPGPTLRERTIWVALAAIPSSLMMGVTTYVTTDVGSAPFLWVIPLALYLLTFIIAFSDKPLVSREITLVLQAVAITICATMLPFRVANVFGQLSIHLLCFFLTALMCHQALVARRPDPAHLTQFYLWMSFGGVVGGAFNAFLAPVIFNSVWEYPLVLALACLVRPGRGPIPSWRWAVILIAAAVIIAAPIWATLKGPGPVVLILLLIGMAGIFLMRGRTVVFFALIVAMSVAVEFIGDRVDVRQSWRSFFGVIRQSEMPVPRMGGQVKMLSHGTTLHGAQAWDSRWRCRPLLYYAPETPIGQVFTHVDATKRNLRIGAVGLGTGSVAAYTRRGDRLTFFEIDPLVIRISTDPAHFSYTTECARGEINYVLGDARLTLAQQPQGIFDVLLIDAFSSDSVPTHLLTVEAVRGYLTHIKPDGVLILHLSNRNLDLRSPAMAVAHAAGGYGLLQQHVQPPGNPALWESSEDALIVARNPQALAAYAADPRWRPTNPNLVRPWTDDYVNLVGALYGRLKERQPWLP